MFVISQYHISLMNILRISILLPLFVSVLPLSGCVQVAPWERGYLAKPQMALEPHPGQALLREHIYGGRESATGGSAASGGGCGCT